MAQKMILARLKYAAPGVALHLVCSMLVAALAALFVFGIWFPFPYRELAGGRELFVLLVSVDVVCGPLLTMVLLNPQKLRRATRLDVSAVVLVQLAALIYGLWVVWQARPLFLVAEIDRFKVISGTQFKAGSLERLPNAMKPGFFNGPLTVGIRLPANEDEKQKVLFESMLGGADYAERAEFFVPYAGDAVQRPLSRARALSVFLEKQPLREAEAKGMAAEIQQPLSSLRYLPIVARQDWVAVLDARGQIRGFLKGDGF